MKDFAKGRIVSFSLQGEDGKIYAIGDGSREMFLPLPRSKRPEVMTIRGTCKASPDVVALIEDAVRDTVRDMISKVLARYIILNLVRIRAGLPVLTPGQFGGSEPR